jgi:hypothetical protein
MVSVAQSAIDEQNKAVDKQRALHEAVTQAMNPKKPLPPTSGDCVLDDEQY